MTTTSFPITATVQRSAAAAERRRASKSRFVKVASKVAKRNAETLRRLA